MAKKVSCLECKYADQSDFFDIKCKRASATIVSTGKKMLLSCSYEREYGHCGKEAQDFVQKTEKKKKTK